jgi:hypothetical protein
LWRYAAFATSGLPRRPLLALSTVFKMHFLETLVFVIVINYLELTFLAVTAWDAMLRAGAHLRVRLARRLHYDRQSPK